MPPRKPRPRHKLVMDQLRDQLGLPADQRIPQDILPAFRPRNRAGEVANSLAFTYPALAGVLSGAGNVAKGVVRFIPDALKGLTSFTPEELRDPAVRKEITDNGWGDPDAMLHEALKARGRGEPVGSTEYVASLLKGTALMGYNLQRAVQGGELYQRDENGRYSLTNPDVSPRERAQAITELVGNAGLLATGVGDKSLPISRLPLSAAGRAAAALRDAVGPSAILPQDWAAGARTPGPGPRTPVGNLNLEAPAFQRPTYKTPVSAPNTSLDVPTFMRRGQPAPHTLGNIRSRFRTLIGGSEPLPRVNAVNETAGRQMAQVYDNLKSDPTNPEVQSAYESFNRETQAQAEALKSAGYTWDFVDHDPYPPTKGGSKAMLRDLRENHHISVYKTAGEQGHPLMTNEQNNLFRAVHEILGHGVDEVPFSAKGEENAFRSHAQMYSPDARRVMATETRGQNSWFNFGPHEKVPAPQRPFAAQKAALWPQDMLGDYNAFPAERIAAPSVKGVDGNYYTGANHDFASEAAADALRATPEGRALMQKNGGSATVRGSQGFKTSTGRYISREEARNVAGATGQAPKLASQYTQLHSSDISNPNNFAGEYPVPHDLIAAAEAPTVGRSRPVFDPSVGAPQLSAMARYGRPESGSILDPSITPGTLLRDVPQTPMDLPRPKSQAEWQDRYQQAMQAFQNPLFQHFLDRGAEMQYPWWYNAEPILGSAIENLGPEMGLERFKTLMRYMKPTSIQTSPEFNLRNAGYQFWRTGNPEAPRFVSGMRPLYPTIMERKLAELEAGGGRMDPLSNPKIEPYGEDFLGNWATHAGDTHFWRAMGSLGLDVPLNVAGDPNPGLWADPVHAALTQTSHEVGPMYVPDVPGRSMVAPLQATMWGGAGELTGVRGIERARPTIWQMFEDAAHRSAQHLEMSPSDFLGMFWRREHPLF